MWGIFQRLQILTSTSQLSLLGSYSIQDAEAVRQPALASISQPMQSVELARLLDSIIFNAQPRGCEAVGIYIYSRWTDRSCLCRNNIRCQ
jgi:hypothetical protein